MDSRLRPPILISMDAAMRILEEILHVKQIKWHQSTPNIHAQIVKPKRRRTWFPIGYIRDWTCDRVEFRIYETPELDLIERMITVTQYDVDIRNQVIADA